LRGAAAAVVKNMSASLDVPTATSVRAIPVKAMIDNRIVINNHLKRTRGGKISFTHLLGYAIVAAVNWLLSHLVGPLGWHTAKPLQEALGYGNAPFAWLMGVPARDCLAVGQILGERIVLNEFFGYISLSAQKAMLSP